MAKKRPSRRKSCRDCGGTDEVIDGLCADCESNYVFCECCQESYHTEGDVCRHVFWTDWGWGGAGSHETDWDYFKEPFFAFLDVMSVVRASDADLDDYPDVVTGIEAEITKNALWTRLEGFMLSMPTLYFYRLRPDLPHRNDDGSPIALFFAQISPDQIYRDDDDCDEDEITDGFAWLQSLCADDTVAANTRTVQWIKEWRNRPKPLRRVDLWPERTPARCTE